MLRNCLAAACLIIFFSSICAADPGDVKWTAQYQPAGNGEVYGMACQGNRVFTAGIYFDLGKTVLDSRPVLISYNARTGSMSPITLFEDTEGVATVVRVKADGKKIYTAGQYSTSGQGHAFVSAYSLKGAQVWERLWLDSDNRYPNDITLFQSKVISAGMDEGGFFNVTALSASNGNILWEDSSDMMGIAYAVAADSGRVFAVGTYFDLDNYRWSWVVRAFDLSNGELLWEDVQGTPGTASGNNYSEAVAVVVDGNRVYVVGSLHTEDSPYGGASFAVRVYDARTGGLVWRDYYDLYGNFDDSASTVELNGSLLFVGGYVTRPSGGQAFVVRAYDASRGTALWSTLSGGYDIEQNSVNALAVSENKVYAAGAATKDYYTGFASKAYNKNKGTILWEDSIGSQTASTNALTPTANSICTSGDAVFTGGTSSVEGAGQAFTVRANSIR